MQEVEYTKGMFVVCNGTVESVCVDTFTDDPIRNFVPEGVKLLPDHLQHGFPIGTYRFLEVIDSDEYEAMVLGWTYRNVGKVFRGHMSTYDFQPEWEPGYMVIDDRIKVWMVMRLGSCDSRYYKPVAVLPSQILSVLSKGAAHA